MSRAGEASGQAGGFGHDPARLGAALAHINAARRRPSGSSGRLRALYEGFETLLEALPGARADRDPGAAGSLTELESLLEAEGAESGAEALRSFLEPILDRLIEALLDFPERRLAVYGSLAPGEDNHERVATLVGDWIDGYVEGTLHDRGWAARRGYPGFVHHIPGPRVPVRVLRSRALPDAWERLDAFEGPGYRRILAPVETAEGLLACYVYELTEPGGSTPRA